MQNIIMIDEKVDDEYLKYLELLDYSIIKVPINNNLYDEISSHVDISVCKVKEKMFIEPMLYNLVKMPGSVCGEETVYSKYPFDIKYNLCSIGDVVVHNFKYTDKKILKYIDDNKLEKINVAQGYTNCSIAVLDDKSCITSDTEIAKKLSKKNIDVLLISKKSEENIKLLKNDMTYSSMHGFIGGCLVKIENKIILFGDSKKLFEREKIIKFITDKGYEFVDFSNKEIIDYGGIVTYMERECVINE